MIHKIITHNGIFHADDVMAVALLHEFIRPTIPVERTRTIAADEFDNPNIWILDVGGQFNAELNNFDHHHDETLHAACMLVLNRLYDIKLINLPMYYELKDSMLAISKIDCTGQGEGFHFNNLIKSLNALDDGFDVALDICRKYIQSCKSTVSKAEESQAIWDRGERISMYIRACDEFPIHWKRYKEQPFLIYPHEGKWNLLSSDSGTHPIQSTGKEEFIHAGKFIAVFLTKEDAIESAQRSVYSIYA